MRTLSLLLLIATAAQAEEELYELVGPFGPKVVSFPWHCAFSPDGR